MEKTQLSLLDALSNKNEQAWEKFYKSYKPLLIRWMRKYAVTEAQADDITQEVMIFLHENINKFKHNQRVGAFRAWLRITTVNITRYYLRQNTTNNVSNEEFEKILDNLVDSNSDLSKLFDQENKQAMVETLLNDVEPYFQKKTLTIFRQHMLEEISAEELAKQHNIVKQQVYIIRSRVLRRLRKMDIDWIKEVLND